MNVRPASVYATAAYVPAFRLSRAALAAARGGAGGRGCRAVASYDEDATSLAVEAGRRLVVRGGPAPERLVVASSSPAYLEKNVASTVHAALGLPVRTGAYDMGGSIRAGAGALLAALEAPRPTMALAADVRVALPGSADEGELGDGAAALLAGPPGPPAAAVFLGHAATTLEVMERWRLPADGSGQTADERLVEHAFRGLAARTVGEALERAEVTATEVARAVATATTRRVGRAAIAESGLPAAVWLSGLEEAIGNAGAAQPMLALIQALETAAPGEVVLLLVLGDGVDVFVFRRGEGPATSPGAGLATCLAGGREDLPYLTYLAWRGLLPQPGRRRPDPSPPAPAPALRNRDWKFALAAARCAECGFVSLPPQRVCPGCGRRDTGVPQRLGGWNGKVVTATTDLLARGPSSPPLMTALIDLDGGGRARFELTDVWADEVQPGERIELTFRRLHTSGGVHDYFWKARPLARGRG
jgi:3-hydroxy-3-methylglutaryl CoA synthase/uncharacterized OB-fold protein